MTKNNYVSYTDNKINRFVRVFANPSCFLVRYEKQDKFGLQKLVPPSTHRFVGAGIPCMYRDYFLAKDENQWPVLRQVTPTNFIAGPLCAGWSLDTS